MRALIVGGGGREHALAWCLSQSPALEALYVAPGNPGTATLAENVPLDLPAIPGFCREHRIDLVIPGPEAPLVAGLADGLAAAGIPCCGPTAAAARLEGSKLFAKQICDEAGIPTAAWERFDDPHAALDFARRRGAPLVIKADGLAAGKGVTVAATIEEAEAAIRAAMLERAHGDAGRTILIEECLEGDEVSLFALCDGERAALLGAAQDHKRLLDGDRGPNTGGMGAISPPPHFPLEAQLAALDLFVRPALAALARAGTPFRGILFAGLMLTAAGPKLIEYNVRLGDPEAQTLLPRLGADLLPALAAAAAGTLAETALPLRDIATASVVIAARGYPVAPVRGGTIHLDRATLIPHTAIFHAGTTLTDGQLRAAGGRVLTVTGTGPTLAAARAAAYEAAAQIHYEDAIYRTDIGARALAHRAA